MLVDGDDQRPRLHAAQMSRSRAGEREQTVSLLLREYESSRRRLAVADQRPARASSNVSARFARAIGRSMDELEGLSILELLKQIPRADQIVAARAGRGRGDDRRARRPSPSSSSPSRSATGSRIIELSARPDLQQAGALHRLSRRRLRRDRRPPGGRPDRPYGPPRRADRPPQPPPADGQSRRGARSRRRPRRANARCCWSISTGSRRSTTASAMSPATICCSRSRAASRR